MKTVAFIISVYKKDDSDYFKESIESIVAQTYGFNNIHIHLGIDGGINSEIENYINNHRHLFHKIVNNESNHGLSYTMNRLIEILEDEQFVFRMDSDDVCREDRVEKTLAEFDKDDELMVLGSDIQEFNMNTGVTRNKIMPKTYEEIIDYSIARNPLNHSTVAIRRSFYQKFGTYDEFLPMSQDYDLWARGLMNGAKIVNISEPLIKYRITNDYIKRRCSMINCICEFKVSMRLLWHFKKYSKIGLIVVKFAIRNLPKRINIFAYNFLRKRV